MLPTLPDNFEIGRGAGGGDGFFHAVAQCIKHLKPDEACSVKTLRRACKRYAITNWEKVISWCDAAALANDAVHKSFHYIVWNGTASKFLAPQRSLPLIFEEILLGVPELQGRIICNIYDVRLHVIENRAYKEDNIFLDQVQDKSSRDYQQFASCNEDVFDTNENEIWKNKLMDKCDCKYVENVNYDAEDTIHILQLDKQLFQPILKQNCESISSDSSDDEEADRRLAYRLRIVAESTKPTDIRLDLIQELLAKGVDIDFQDCNDKRNTILHVAIRRKDHWVTLFLLENGADFYIKNSNEICALNYIRKKVYRDMKDGLLEECNFLNMNQRKHEYDVQSTIEEDQSHELDEIPKRPVFRRCSDDEGASGQRAFEHTMELIHILCARYGLLNINEARCTKDNQRTTNEKKSNDLDDISNIPKFRRRSDDDGASGQRYEVNLLILFKLRGEHLTNKFYLGGNFKEAEDFDDVVFKYWDKYGSRTIFLQAKHKQNPTHRRISFETFFTDKDFDLEKYFKSYLKIRETFKKGIVNPIFQGEFQDIKCDFVILTNALLDEGCNSLVLQDTAVCSFPIGTGGKVVKLKPECAILTNKECTEYISLVSKIFIEFFSKANKYSMMAGNELVKEYHVFWAQRVLEVDAVVHAKRTKKGLPGNEERKYRIAKFREEFLHSTSDDKLFSQFTNQVLKNLTVLGFLNKTIEVPEDFGNIGTALHLSHSTEKFCEKFIQLINDNLSSHICKVFDVSDRTFLKDICKLVGRVLVLNCSTGFLRLNDTTLEGESKDVRDSLSSAMTSAGLECQTEFDFQIKGCPKLALIYKSQNEADIIDFINKLYIFTGQPSVNGMDELIKQEIKDFFKLTNDEAYQSYLRINDKMTKYWMQTEKVAFVRKGDEFFNNIIRRSTHFRLRYPVPSFTGRVEQLKVLHESLQKNQLVTICGLGGIGKSELARKYAAMYGSCYEDNIIWINAESVATARYSFRTLCRDILNIPVTNEKGRERDIEHVVKDVFGFFRKRRSLFIFDNASSYKNLSYDDENGIKEFLPKRLSPDLYNPCIIITSRNENWPTENIIPLHTFSDEEAIAFVKTFLKIADDSEDDRIKKLINALQNFPLALQQAVSYIRENADPRFNTKEFRIADYMQLYDEMNKGLLSFTFPEDSLDLYRSTTYNAWNITIQRIHNLKFGHEAFLIMSLLAYLDPNGIDIEFFSAGMQMSQEVFRGGLNLLRQYSLITLEDGMVSVHRLVQEVTRINLKDQQMEKDILKAALLLVIRNYAEDKHVVHGMSVWNFARHYNVLVEEFNIIPTMVAKALEDTTRYDEAFSFAEKSSLFLDSLLGPDHNGTLCIQHVLSSLLGFQGRYKEALAFSGQIYERQCKVHGADHPTALLERKCIASTLLNQGKYDEALKIFSEIFQKYANFFGPDDRCTLDVQRCIGVTLTRLGNYDEAFKVLMEVFDKTNAILGPENVLTLNVQYAIANVISAVGKIDKALKMYLEIFDKQKNTLGPNDPSILSTQNDIALLFLQMGNHAEAFSLFSELIDKQNKVIGPDNPLTLNTRRNIAKVLSEQGRYDEALAQYYKAYAKEVELLGPENPSTLITEHDIANTFMHQGKHEDALTAFTEVCVKMNKVLGPDHPFTLTCQHNIGFLLSKQGKYDDALKSYYGVYEKEVKILGPDNPKTLTCLINIAGVLVEQGKYDDAQTLYERCFEKYLRSLGPDHPSTLITEHRFANVLSLQGQHRNGLKILWKVFEKQVRIFGPENLNTLDTENTIGNILCSLGSYDEALSKYMEVFNLLQKILGPDNPETLSTQLKIASVLSKQGKHEDALKTYLDVFGMQSASIGPENPDTLTTEFKEN